MCRKRFHAVSRVKDRAIKTARKMAPSFIFGLSLHFSSGQNRESRSSVFLCSETARKRLLCRLALNVFIFTMFEFFIINFSFFFLLFTFLMVYSLAIVLWFGTRQCLFSLLICVVGYYTICNLG